MQKLIRMRKENDVAIYGDFKEYEPENENLYIYERNYESQKMFVVLNFSEKKVKFTMPEEWKNTDTEYIIGNYECKVLEDRELMPYEAMVYLSKGN